MRCDWCGRFGAVKHVEDRGPNGHGGRLTYTYYECMACTARLADPAAAPVRNVPIPFKVDAK